MLVKTVELADNKILVKGRDEDAYINDGIYRNEHGDKITIHERTMVVYEPKSSNSAGEQMDIKECMAYIEQLETALQTVGDDAQLANIDLQNMLQKQQQTIQMLSNISKVLHDTAMAIIRKMG